MQKTVRSSTNCVQELIDRFGSLPDAGKFLLANAAIRLQAQALGIKRM